MQCGLGGISLIQQLILIPDSLVIEFLGMVAVALKRKPTGPFNGRKAGPFFGTEAVVNPILNHNGRTFQQSILPSLLADFIDLIGFDEWLAMQMVLDGKTSGKEALQFT